MKNSTVSASKRSLPAAPEPPRGLTAEARRWWSALQEEYGISDAAGLLLLQTAAEQFMRMRAEERVLDREGSTVRDRFGQPKQHPAVLNAREARSSMLKCLRELNFDLEPLRDRPGGSVSKR